MRIKILKLGALLAAAHLAGGMPAIARAPVVNVTAWGQHYGGKVTYRYELQNRSDRPIRRFLIGLYRPRAGDGAAELSVEPGNSGPSFWLSEAVTSRPTGWGVSLFYPDESETFALEWIEAGFFPQRAPLSPPTLDNAPTPMAEDQAIAPGKSVSFSATVDSIDTAYVTGHATVHVGNESICVPITKGDAKAPTVKINALRLNQNVGRGEWALFRISADVTDDFDPNPAVSTTPVSSNQPLASNDITMDKNGSSAWNARFRNVPGRSYTFSVRAMDASGNVGVESFVYQVER